MKYLNIMVYTDVDRNECVLQAFFPSFQGCHAGKTGPQ